MEAEGCFGFPPLLVLIDPAPQSRVSLTPEVLPATLSTTRGHWPRPWVHLGVTHDKGDQKLLCLQLAAASGQCHLKEHGILRKLAACLTDISSPPCDIVSSLLAWPEQT